MSEVKNKNDYTLCENCIHFVRYAALSECGVCRHIDGGPEVAVTFWCKDFERSNK